MKPFLLGLLCALVVGPVAAEEAGKAAMPVAAEEAGKAAMPVAAEEAGKAAMPVAAQEAGKAAMPMAQWVEFFESREGTTKGETLKAIAESYAIGAERALV